MCVCTCAACARRSQHGGMHASVDSVAACCSTAFSALLPSPPLPFPPPLPSSFSPPFFFTQQPVSLLKFIDTYIHLIHSFIRRVFLNKTHATPPFSTFAFLLLISKRFGNKQTRQSTTARLSTCFCYFLDFITVLFLFLFFPHKQTI